MKSSFNNVKLNKSIDTILILILLTVFSIGALILVFFSAKVYKNINDSLNTSFNQSMPLSYIASKIRMCSYNDTLYVDEIAGSNALVIKNDNGEFVSSTWIYVYNGQIYEIYVEEGTDFEPDSGVPILKCDKLTFQLKNKNIINATATVGNSSSSISVAVRNFGGGKTND